MQDHSKIGEITHLLQAWTKDPACIDAVITETYGELYKLAEKAVASRKTSQTLPPTALVNEACLKLIPKRNLHFGNRLQYYALAGLIMRHILADHAKMKDRKKRNVPITHFDPDREEWLDTQTGVPFEALDDALNALADHDPRKARVVELKYFAGLAFTEIGELLGLSETTVKRDWRMARAWLFGQLRRTE